MWKAAVSLRVQLVQNVIMFEFFGKRFLDPKGFAATEAEEDALPQLTTRETSAAQYGVNKHPGNGVDRTTKSAGQCNRKASGSIFWKTFSQFVTKGSGKNVVGIPAQQIGRALHNFQSFYNGVAVIDLGCSIIIKVSIEGLNQKFSVA